MTENDLYELVADFGEVYGTALRRESYLTRAIDWPDNWLEIALEIGEERADLLRNASVAPTENEMKELIRWQVEKALEQNDPDTTPTLWLCRTKECGEILAIESWGASLNTELRFTLIGRFPDETSAIIELRSQYIFSADDLDLDISPIAPQMSRN